MILHIGSYELPPKKNLELNENESRLTDEEIRIIKKQIRANSSVIYGVAEKLDLYVNKEKYPHKEKFLNTMRDKLVLLIEENDTFRKVLWQNMQAEYVSN